MPETRTPGPRHLDADACVDLVNGLLAPEERRDLLAHAARCADCEAQLRAVAATHERGRARAAGVLAGAAGAVPAGVVRLDPTRSRRQLWLAAAAVVVVFGGAWLVVGRTVPGTRGGTPGFVRLPIVDAARLAADRDGSGLDSLVFAGLAAYQRGDFQTAERLLQGTRADRGMELMRRSFLASAQLGCGRPESALVTLERVRPTQLPEPWRSESEWTRMVALARAGRRASADSLLKLLSQGVGPVPDRARRVRAGNHASP